MGFQNYISESKKESLETVKKQLKTERNLIDTDKARKNLSAFSKGKIGQGFKTGFFGDPDKEASIVQLLGIDDEIRSLREGKKLSDYTFSNENIQKMKSKSSKSIK